MSLTKKQKEQLKKEVKNTPLEKVAKNLGIELRKAKVYLTKIWGKEKYKRISASHLRGVSPHNHPVRGRQVQHHLGGETTLKKWLVANWKTLVFLAFLVFAVYLNSLGNDFVSDDIGSIKDNPLIDNFSYLTSSRFNPRSVIIFFTHKLFGLNPAFFRLSNILFHLGSAWVIYFLLGFFFSSPIPFFTASIFAVHPILTEAVIWISGGPYSNSAFFIFLSLTAYLLWKKNSKKCFYLISILSFIFALGFSEKVFWFPVILVLLEFCFDNLKKNWLKLIPYVVISGFWVVYILGLVGPRITSLETGFYQEPGIDNPLIKIPIAITSYLELIFWPKNLTLYHSEMTFTQTQYFLRLGLFILFVTGLFYFFKKDRRILFWLMFFLISLSPTLSPLRVAWTVAERYVYLGALGIFLLIGLWIHKIGEVFKNQKVSYVVFIVALLALSFRTTQRNFDWKNQDTLWLATAKTSPSSSQNHNNLGDLYARRGEFEKAIEEFKKAIELLPNYADAYHNLANVYHQIEKDDLAIKNYQKALQFNPNLWQSHQNLAAIYFNQEKFAQAQEELQNAIEINPTNVNLYLNLGIIYLKLGEKEQASASFQKALILDPQNQNAKQLLLQLTP